MMAQRGECRESAAVESYHHPLRPTQKEQKIAEQQSALINKAYETLREPLQRAHLLVRMAHGEGRKCDTHPRSVLADELDHPSFPSISSAQLEKYASSVPSEAESLEDPEVLMEVMELREGLDDAGTEDDAAAVRQKNKGVCHLVERPHSGNWYLCLHMEAFEYFTFC